MKKEMIRPNRTPDFYFEFEHMINHFESGIYQYEVWIPEKIASSKAIPNHVKNKDFSQVKEIIFEYDFKEEYDRDTELIKSGSDYRQLYSNSRELYEEYLERDKK